MIEYPSGDILQCEANALVNTVNCVGVMGRGIALQFKNVYPENFKAYEAACKHEAVQPGRMFVFETGQLTLPRFIINFPAKRHWRGKSRIEDIDAGLVDLVNVIRDKGIRSIAIPPLGAGLGGLDWNEVRPRIERALAELAEVRVLVFEPKGVRPTTRWRTCARLNGQVRALGQHLAQQPVCVLTGASLPGAVWVTKVHTDVRLARQLAMPAHLFALVVGQGLAQRRGNRVELGSEGRQRRLGRGVGHFGQQHQARGALDQHSHAGLPRRRQEQEES